MNEPDKPYSAENTLEVYSEASGNWTVIPLDYCLVTAEGIGAEFRVWDTVTDVYKRQVQPGPLACLFSPRTGQGHSVPPPEFRPDALSGHKAVVQRDHCLLYTRCV